MTEERFKFVNNYGDWHLKDSFNNQEIAYDLTSPSMDRENWTNVCNLLNKQDKTIQELEKENTFIKGLRQYYMSMIQSADALISAKGTDEMKELWENAQEENFQKWRKENE